MPQYIDKDALVSEINELKKEVGDDEYCHGYDIALDEVLYFINSLEVKEVDLDFQWFAKEIDEVFDLPSEVTTNTEEEPLNWEYAIAKHFFELGVKVAQKGE